MAPKQPCAKYQYVVTPAGPKILPVDEPSAKDEESPAEYNAGGYLPVKVNDTFSRGRYRVLRKLGWGHFSTVWLVKDHNTDAHSALKVVKSASRYAETARDEIKLLSRVASFSPDHPGRAHIVSFLDSFSHQGPEASHVCIVFEPLGENLLALIERNKKKGVPRSLVKVIAKQILLGLEYLHDECDLVHTDIKPENILISIPDIEAHIHTELSLSPSPTSRRVGVPLPTKSRSGVSIPSHRGTRRQVQIFDSQPLASPGRSAGFPTTGPRGSGSANGSGSNSVVSSYITPTVVTPPPLTHTSGTVLTLSSTAKRLGQLSSTVPQTTNPRPPSITASSSSSSDSLAVSKPSQATNSPSSTSSSSSSLASSHGVASTSSLFSTPPTSLSHSFTNAAAGLMKMSSDIFTPSSSSTIKKREGKEPERMGVPIGGPKSSVAAEDPTVSWADKIVPTSWKDRISFAISSSPTSTNISDTRRSSTLSVSRSWKDPGLSSPAPAVVVSAVVRADGEEDGDYFRVAGTSVSDSTTSTSESSSATVTLRPSPTRSSPLVPSPSSECTVKPAGSPLRSSFTTDPLAPNSSRPSVSTNNPSLLSQTAPSRVRESTGPLRASPPHHSSLLSAHMHTHSTEQASAQDIKIPTKTSSRRSSRMSPASPAIDTTVKANPSAPPPTPNTVSSPVTSLSDSTLTDTTPKFGIDVPSIPPVQVPVARPPPVPISVKIADLGNATPSKKHYTEDIQTRQYRAPEAILGRKDWDARADIWSVACLLFELLTGEYLFDPQGQGDLFTKDDDHMAQIIELLGDFPLEAKLGGKYSKEVFDHTGSLRYIRSLKFWPLDKVMTEKYMYTPKEASDLCTFLLPMLAADMRNRVHARDMINHVWLAPSDSDEVVDVW